MTELGGNSNLTQIEIEIIIDKAVRKTFITLGADLSEPNSVISLQKDFAHMHNSRVGGEQTAEFVKKGVVGIFISGFLWALWQGFQVVLAAKGVK